MCMELCVWNTRFPQKFSWVVCCIISYFETKSLCSRMDKNCFQVLLNNYSAAKYRFQFESVINNDLMINSIKNFFNCPHIFGVHIKLGTHLLFWEDTPSKVKAKDISRLHQGYFALCYPGCWFGWVVFRILCRFNIISVISQLGVGSWRYPISEIGVARPGFEPQSPCSTSQELLKPLDHHRTLCFTDTY